MKKLYMLQVNYPYGKSAHLPYTAGALVAYAINNPKVKNEYELCDIIFLRDKIDTIVSKIIAPDVIGFSTYIWNFEFNKTVAKRIKDIYPDCTIIFGGHHVVPGGELLNQAPYIDYLIHGEGEEAFLQLLIGTAPKNIAGVSYRDNSTVITNKPYASNSEYIDYPSPYLTGVFDKILDSYPNTDFMALIETTRGCPNSCSYCDWSNMKSRIRKFPLKRVLDEIRFISENHIYGLGSADSNFGVFERDEQIADYIVEMYLKNGYPKGYQTSYAKNSNERIFRIGQALEKYGLSKGITLSFQSMSDEVLKNIGRQNIPVSNYSQLMEMYSAAGIATYTELILGLPGETYDSFACGIDRLLNLGQHASLYIHNCEWLPCSTMGTKEYTQKFGIETSLIPLNQPHIEEIDGEDIPEFSKLVTKTCSMTHNDWIKMNIFSFTVQCFHHMGLLQFFALYLYREKNISYRSFYEKFVSWAKNTDICVGNTILLIEQKLKNITDKKNDAAFVYVDKRFGAVHWPFEEYLFLSTVYDLDDFYSAVKSFLSHFNIEDDLFIELLSFQKEMIKLPFVTNKNIKFNYNFTSYFRSILSGGYTPLKKEPNKVTITAKPYDSWQSYAKWVVWYGRKDNKNVYINDCTETTIKLNGKAKE